MSDDSDVQISSVVPAPGAPKITLTRQDAKDKPLLRLLLRLINKDSKENTVLSNPELKDILKMELDVDLDLKDELESDIYMSVLKTFLKSWPKWEEFDNTLRKRNADEKIHNHYDELKEYLKHSTLLTSTHLQPLLKKAKQRQSRRASKTKMDYSSEAVLEVNCSREQLNTLFYQGVHPTSLTIFNVKPEPANNKISTATINFQQILNWPYVNVTINLPGFEYTRKNSSHFARTLINKKLPMNETRVFETLPNTLFWKKNQAIAYRKQTGDTETVLNLVNKLILLMSDLSIKSLLRKEHYKNVLHQVKLDLLTCTENRFCIGTEYQFFLSKYPYVRYLCKQLTAADYEETGHNINPALKEDVDFDAFDLQLEEVIKPAVTFQINKTLGPSTVDKFDKTMLTSLIDGSSNWLKVECTSCDEKFDACTTVNLYVIEQHFTEVHKSEPDWSCCYCGEQFNMTQICQSRWQHVCNGQQ